MSTKRRLREVRIGEPRLHNDSITLVEYDPQWALLFQRERARVAEALGENVLRLEHVGSTSVPGLVAKPVIDVLLEVYDSSDEDAYVPALESAGYALQIREPDWHEHRLLRPAGRDVNLHVFSAGCLEVTRMLRLRDQLRSDDADRALYADAKRTLAQRRWQYVQDYADAKSEIVEAILKRASTA
jgi:GrpB-like predicted nucleotidyltransferase (UPF0157 family)